MYKSTAAGITETAAAAGGCQRVIVRLPAASNGACVQYCLLFFLTFGLSWLSLARVSS